jgi:hypothetical protein
MCGRAVSILLIHKTNEDSRGVFSCFFSGELFTHATGSRFYETEN